MTHADDGVTYIDSDTVRIKITDAALQALRDVSPEMDESKIHPSGVVEWPWEAEVTQETLDKLTALSDHYDTDFSDVILMLVSTKQ